MKVALIGVGMIGGSLLAAWRQAGLLTAAAGFDIDPQALATATGRGLIERSAGSVAEAVAGADLVLVATPVGAMGEVFGQLAPALAPDAVVRETQIRSRRERLMATLRGEPVDRPAVNFHEVGGFKVDLDDPDPYNVYNGPDRRLLVTLAEEHTDIIRMMSPVRARSHDPTGSEFSPERDRFFQQEVTSGSCGGESHIQVEGGGIRHDDSVGFVSQGGLQIRLHGEASQFFIR